MDIQTRPLLIFRVKRGIVLSERHRRIVRQSVHDVLMRTMASGDVDVLIEDEDEYEAFIRDLQQNIDDTDVGEAFFRCLNRFGLPNFDVKLIIVADDVLLPPDTPPKLHERRRINQLSHLIE